jgi:hypothetical protein
LFKLHVTQRENFLQRTFLERKVRILSWLCDPIHFLPLPFSIKTKINQVWKQIIEKSPKIWPKNLRDRDFIHLFHKKCIFFSKFGDIPFGINNTLKFKGHGVAQVVQHHCVQADQELLDVGLQLWGLADIHGIQRHLHDVTEVLKRVYYLYFLDKASSFYCMAAVSSGFWAVHLQVRQNSPSESAP